MDFELLNQSRLTLCAWVWGFSHLPLHVLSVFPWFFCFYLIPFSFSLGALQFKSSSIHVSYWGPSWWAKNVSCASFIPPPHAIRYPAVLHFVDYLLAGACAFQNLCKSNTFLSPSKLHFVFLCLSPLKTIVSVLKRVASEMARCFIIH